MKRLFSVLLIAALLFSFAYAEEEYSTDFIEIRGKIKNLTDHELDLLKLQIETEKYVRSLKGEKSTQQEKAPDDLGIWKEKYFVDEFDEPTDVKYITTSSLIEGTFSNSAATNKKLYVKIIIQMSSKYFKDDKIFPILGIDLYEYGDNKVKNSGVNENPYLLSIRDENNETRAFKCYMPKKGDRIYISDKYTAYGFGSNADFMEALKNGKTIKFRLKDEDKYSISTYAFQIDDTTGFENALKWLIGEE